MLRENRLDAGVQQQEAARAVGALGLALLETALSDERGLLIAEHARDRDAVVRSWHPDRAERRRIARRRDRREHRARNPEQLELGIAPGRRAEIHAERPARIRHVGRVDAAVRTAAQIPDEPRVDRPREQLAAGGAVARAGDVLEDPRELRAGEVGRDRKARQRLEPPDAALRCEVAARVLGAHVLPDDRVADGLAGLPIPDDDGLTLVRDADGSHVAWAHARGLGRAAHDVLHARQDLERIVLDPAGPRIDLPVLGLVLAGDPPLAVEEDAPAARRSLIDRRDQDRPSALLFLLEEVLEPALQEVIDGAAEQVLHLRAAWAKGASRLPGDGTEGSRHDQARA